ncbi:sensor histidine kinase [Natranaerobius thermophilus]
MLRGEEGIQTIKTPDDEKRVVIHSPIPNTDGWSLGIDFSKSEMTKDTDQLILTIIVFGGIIIAVLIIISLALSSSIANPIIHLQQLMKKAEQGDLDVTFNYNNKDEIGQLGAGFNNMIQKIKTLINLLDKEHHQKRKNELKVLQSQIKPHFLYNTLDTIRWSILEDNSQEAVELLEELGTFYRIGLNSGDEYITIEKELDHIESYLRLQKARYEDMLNYQVKYDENLTDNKILKLILQPIVENAILHGFKNQDYSTCEIILELIRENNELVTIIKNNGSRLSFDELKRINHALKTNEKPGENIGFGLYSTNMRIQLAYGTSYGLNIDVENGWTKVTIRFPLVKGED